jgi:hypothetical protein
MLKGIYKGTDNMLLSDHLPECARPPLPVQGQVCHATHPIVYYYDSSIPLYYFFALEKLFPFVAEIIRK